jgi:glutamate-5-semialdehyde dehydrogenase
VEKEILLLNKVKESSDALCDLDPSTPGDVLMVLSKKLMADAQIILRENAKDLAQMPKTDPRFDRLLLSIERIQSMANDLVKIAHLPSPIGKVMEDKVMENGLRIQKISVPLGVIGVIYESRPNVTIDVFALCFKAGNACVLKGGKEAQHSNRALVAIIEQVLKAFHIPINILYLMSPTRKATRSLLNARGVVDVCIPRGSQALIDFVREHAKIPVIETGAGIVHTYFDKSGDLEKGQGIIDNAKTRRVSVCNALDTLVIHQERLSDLGILLGPLSKKSVEIFADDLSYAALSCVYPSSLLHLAAPEDFGREFLSYKMSVKTVLSLEEAVQHIQKHSSGHSEAIIAEDQESIAYFLKHVDAAALYANASTAFTDGGEFGLAAEIGISTQKLHARGPMGLEALTSYKWLVFGNGQIRQ